MNSRLKFGVIFLAVVVFIVVGSYIGGKLSPYDEQTSGIYSKVGGYAEIAESDIAIERGPILPPEPGYGTLPATEPILDRKIIKSAYLGIQVEKFKNSFQQVMGITETVDGFITSSNSFVNDAGYESGNIQIRVPVDKFNEALNLLEGVGEVKSRNIVGNDVTEEYIDIKAQLDNLKKEEQRFLEILEKAEEVEDILNIERELSRVRTQIDYNTGRLNFLDNRVEYATIDVNLYEEQLIKEGGLLDIIKESLNLFVRSIKNLVLFVGVILPYVIIILIVLAVIKVYKEIRKTDKKRY